MKPPKKLGPLSIRLDPDVRAGYQAIAESEDRSLAYVINRTLKRNLELERAKAKK
jgi:predicted transcriptional regulator